jgi:hypothetical protein
MKVGFQSQGLTLRGSEVAMLDYALHNESILGNRSYLAVPERPGLDSHPVFQSWQAKLPCLVYRNREDLAAKLRKEGVEVLYQIKPGRNDGFLVPGVRNCIHAMFAQTEFHGDVYAYVSRWLSRVMTGREDRFVPHLVQAFPNKGNWRVRLGIPADARVFGRHGGADTFNLPFAQEAVRLHAEEHPEDHFCFLHTNNFLPRGMRLPNVHFLPGTNDLDEKGAFLHTCDAMIHAREHGETFGLAVGEFAVLGKPVITFACSRERAHLDLMGQEALTYRNRSELRDILRNFIKSEAGKTAYHNYTDPKTVMEIFQRIFLS